MNNKRNEEKANEIGYTNSRQYRHNYGGDEFVFSSEECTQSALEMAKWKDQQFKDAINSTLDYFDRGREAGFVSENSYNDMRYFASKAINELFGE